jgi:hypothetical protein
MLGLDIRHIYTSLFFPVETLKRKLIPGQKNFIARLDLVINALFLKTQFQIEKHHVVAIVLSHNHREGSLHEFESHWSRFFSVGNSRLLDIGLLELHQVEHELVPQPGVSFFLRV